jgi:hypothetical protein
LRQGEGAGISIKHTGDIKAKVERRMLPRNLLQVLALRQLVSRPLTHTSVSALCEDRPHAASAANLLLCISAFKLLVHLYAGRHYGYFVDELYYLACSRHLDWGYVDQPPLIALIAWMARFGGP